MKNKNKSYTIKIAITNTFALNNSFVYFSQKIYNYCLSSLLILMATALMIDCKKIANWLEERKKLDKNWYNLLKTAEDKISILIKDHDTYKNYPILTQYIMLNQQSFQYDDVNNFVDELLKTPLAQQKSLMFGYSDKNVKQWIKLQKFMGVKLVGVLSLAKFIKQTLTFQLPGLDKNIELMVNQQSNLSRKIDFNQNTIYQQEKERQKQEKLFGIDSNLSIEEQITKLVRSTPKLLLQLIIQIQQAKSQSGHTMLMLLQIYNNVCEENGVKNRLEHLKILTKKGDQFVSQNEGKQLIQQILKQSQSNELDHSLKYLSFYEWKTSNQWEIQIQGGSSSTKKQYKHTILTNRNHRQALLYNLNELLYFYTASKNERSRKITTMEVENQLTKLTDKEVQDAITHISQILNNLTSKKLSMCFELENSTKAYQQLVTKFSNYNKNIDHLRRQIFEYCEQISALQTDKQKLIEKLRYLRIKVVKAKNFEQKLLTQHMKREVRITGEINKLQ